MHTLKHLEYQLMKIVDMVVGGDMNDNDMLEKIRPSIEETRSMGI